MGNSSSNYKDKVNTVDIELDFEIDPNAGQEKLRKKFGYYFNKRGECRSVKTDERVGRFPSQQEYEEFGSAIEEYVFWILKNQYKMQEIKIDEDNDDNNDNDNDKSKSKKPTKKKENKIANATIFLSPQYGEKETLLLLIPGSGAVRAGQWARSICINDNLAAGCMYPFIAEAYKRDWGVVLFDPNGRTSGGRVYSGAHVERVYDKYIEDRYLSQKDCKIKNVLIVCHSAGGMATTSLLNDKTKYLLGRIRGVAGTDTFFGHAKNKKVQQVYKRYVVNWVASSQSTGTILSNQTVPKRVSAGHNSHEYTSAAAFPQIISYFDAHLKMYNMQNKNKTKNDKNDKKVDDKEEKEIKEKPKEVEKENKTDAEPNNDNDDGDNDETMKDTKDENVKENVKEKEKEEEEQCDVDDKDKEKGDKEQTNDVEKEKEKETEKEVDDKSKEENNDKMDVDS